MYSQLGLLGFGDEIVSLVIVAVIAYLVGNISPAILLGRLHGIDIKKEGSGNAGTTNVLRVLGKKAAVITLLVDILKGTLSVIMAGLLIGQMAGMIATVSVFCGHVWPVFFGFKGGKGVATAFGALAGLNPALGFSALGIVILGVIISRRMSFGSVIGAATFPILCYMMEKDFIYLGTILAIIVLFKHRENIKRLLRGEEPKLGHKRKAETKEV